jgi:AraC-like DNA-binding protein
MAGRDRAALWRVRELPGTDLLRAQYVDHAFSRHAHEEYAIGVVLAGVEAFAYRGEHHRAPAGAIVVVEPEHVHTGAAGTAAGWEYRMLYPPIELVTELTGAGGPPRFDEAVLDDPALARRLADAHRLLERGSSALERQSALGGVLRGLVGRHARRGLPDETVPRAPAGIALVRAALADDPLANPTLQELGALAGGLSPYQLSRAFRAHTGLPPHAYLVHIRVRRARQLLNSGASPAEAAAGAGFADQSHLHRHFTRIVGVTPGAYARANRAFAGSAADLIA